MVNYKVLLLPSFPSPLLPSFYPLIGSSMWSRQNRDNTGCRVILTHGVDKNLLLINLNVDSSDGLFLEMPSQWLIMTLNCLSKIQNDQTSLPSMNRSTLILRQPCQAFGFPRLLRVSQRLISKLSKFPGFQLLGQVPESQWTDPAVLFPTHGTLQLGSLHRPLNKCPVGPWATPWSLHCGRSVSFFPKNPTLNFPVRLFSLYKPAVSCSRPLGWEHWPQDPSPALRSHSLPTSSLSSWSSVSSSAKWEGPPSPSYRAVERIWWRDCHFLPLLWAWSGGCLISHCSWLQSWGSLWGGEEREAGVGAHTKCWPRDTSIVFGPWPTHNFPSNLVTAAP